MHKNVNSDYFKYVNIFFLNSLILVILVFYNGYKLFYNEILNL